MNTDDCIFCKIAAGQIHSNKIYEDDSIFAFLDIGPISDGHTLVIPKLHFQYLHECPVDIVEKLSGIVARVAAGVVAAMECDGYNILCNNGRAAGQLVEHLHFHIIPRKMDDDLFARWPSYAYAEGQARSIVAKITAKL